jgi:hypothetical protein
MVSLALAVNPGFSVEAGCAAAGGGGGGELAAGAGEDCVPDEAHAATNTSANNAVDADLINFIFVFPLFEDGSNSPNIDRG